jgi:hypothetical protein
MKTNALRRFRGVLSMLAALGAGTVFGGVGALYIGGVVYPERRSAKYQPYSRETGDGVPGLEDQDQTNRDV